jgi:hypothetical protein
MLVRRPRNQRSQNAHVGLISEAELIDFLQRVHTAHVQLDEELRLKIKKKWGADALEVRTQVGKYTLDKIIPFSPTGFADLYKFSTAKSESIPASKVSEYDRDKSFYNGWSAHYQGWLSFYIESIDVNYFPIEAGYKYDQVEKKRQELIPWQKKADEIFQAKSTIVEKPVGSTGAKTTSTDADSGAPDSVSPFDFSGQSGPVSEAPKTQIPWTPILLGGGALVAVAYLVKQGG